MWHFQPDETQFQTNKNRFYDICGRVRFVPLWNGIPLPCKPYYFNFFIVFRLDKTIEYIKFKYLWWIETWFVRNVAFQIFAVFHQQFLSFFVGFLFVGSNEYPLMHNARSMTLLQNFLFKQSWSGFGLRKIKTVLPAKVCIMHWMQMFSKNRYCIWKWFRLRKEVLWII